MKGLFWKYNILLFVSILLGTYSINAQKIIYGEIDRDDLRDMVFEVIGKTGNNYQVFKFQRNKGYICTYNENMEQIERKKCSFFPDPNRVINADFVNYNDYSVIIYQYQKKNIVYCDAAKIDSLGNLIGSVINLDTTKISFFTDNKLYNFLKSDDKQKIGLFKTQKRNGVISYITTLVFDKDLNRISKERIGTNIKDNDIAINEFTINNEGTFGFLKVESGGWGGDFIRKVSVVTHPEQAKTLQEKVIDLKDIFLDDVRLKPDNINKKWVLSSFYSENKRGNTNGLFTAVTTNNPNDSATQFVLKFNEQLKREAKGDNTIKSAFNDYVIRSLILRKDGGFIIHGESYYVSGANNNYNRFDNWSNYNRNFWVQDYYAFSPYYNYFYQPWRNGFNNNNFRRFHADNIVSLSVSSNGTLEWSQVINKSQFDDQSENFLSYNQSIVGGQVLFLFNKQERGDWLLNMHGITPDGVYTRFPTLKNLDKGFEFLPRLGKQINNKTIIMPCKYRNYICFAKIEY
jgi:hypothetical protein